MIHSRRNTRRLLAEGGHEVGAGHYPLIVGLHAAWLLALLLLVPSEAPVNWPLLALFLALQAAPVGAGEPRPVLDHPDRYSAGGAPAALAHAKWLAILAHAKWLAMSWGLDDAPASLSAPLLALAPFQPVEKYQ